MRLLVAVLGVLLSVNAFGWWNEEWTQRKQITVNTTAAGAGTQSALADVPVLVRLHSGNFPQFLALADGGADFRFVAADDQTPLKFHVERFDAVSEMAFVWVRLPSVAPASDQESFHLYFGNAAAPAASDAGATFDVDTAAAFHFNESGGLPVDSTAYGTRVASGELFPAPASLIGSGATLPGGEPLVLAPAPQLQLDPARGWTFETWVRLNGVPAEPVYLLDFKAVEGARLSILVDAAGVAAQLGASEARVERSLGASEWHHVALAVSGDGLRLFLDGVEAAVAPAALTAMSGPVHIGGSADGGGLLAADLDELRISGVARSADWIAFNALVQGSANDRVLGYGLDMSGDGGPEKAGNFGIIFQNVFGKPEAWVEQSVIVLCGLMMLAAAVIMFLKSMALSRAAAATKKFLAAFGGLGQKQGEDDLAALYGERQLYRESPLWRVYHVGIDEVHKRMSPAVGADFAGLEAKSLAAVRAAMDAMMVRESQRLNSQLVLLTIAISGGPFIGLFGTVVGVMVTFAAIAATGDVNIAAIAPGMAAALLATVAGLGVAIPALFGYNWLSARAKDQLADMRVFGDELEARFAELYGR
jgi:biopolymer transport protein ExbB